MKRILACVCFLFYMSQSNAAFIGIPQAEFQSFYKTQNSQMWCWAASAAMVMRYQGVKVNQEDIVAHIKGGLVNAPGSLMEMTNAVNFTFPVGTGTASGRTVISGQAVAGAPIPAVVFNHLKMKNPVLLTYSGGGIGHAVVLTGVDATFSGNFLNINKIYIFDPYPFHPFDPTFTVRSELIYREYPVFGGPMGVMIPPGLITGMILVNSTTGN